MKRSCTTNLNMLAAYVAISVFILLVHAGHVGDHVGPDDVLAAHRAHQVLAGDDGVVLVGLQSRNEGV